MVTILDDADVARLADMADLVEVYRTTLAGDATGSVAAPPRIAVDIDPGSLVFTVGDDRDAVGFRVYALAGTEVAVARHLLARQGAA